MANRGGSHVDVVTERRLKPIYDNLDNGNYKTALQLAEKVLKKHKDLHCAKVLKALAILRMGKSAESLVLTQEVVAVKPSDEPTLQALSICFREMQKPELVVQIYTEAVKACPANEEYHTHLFMALVRIGDYKRQQQVAMGLYKAYPKNPYYFWGVMSIVMQGLTASDPKLANMMYLPLAEKMIEKMANDKKIEAEAEVTIYLMVLDYLGRHEKAMEVIDGDLGNFLQSDFNAKGTKKAELLVKLERWPEVNSTHKELIDKYPDNWSFFQQYFKSACALIDQGWTLPEDESEKEKLGSPDHTETQVIDFIMSRVAIEKEKLSEENRLKKSHQMRAPYLAQMELLRIMTGRSSPEAHRIGSITDMLLNYFAIYGDKPVCFSDIAPYLELVPSSDHNSFIQSLQDTVKLEKKEGEDIAYAVEAKPMQRHVCILQISQRLGLHSNLSSDDKQSLVVELVERHQRGLALGENLLKTDLQYSDHYLLLAVHLLLDMWQQGEEDSYLLSSIVLLEQGHKTSKSNHHFKLLLIRLYCIIGAYGPVTSLYEGSEIKHIQQDTVGYSASRFVVPAGHLTRANSLFHTFLKFYTGNHKETTEYIITAYKFGTFHKVPEFMKFRDRISHSTDFAITTVEKMLLELYQEAENGTHTLQDMVRDMEIVPEKDETEWDNLHDNRDLDVLLSWEPKENRLSESQKQESTAQEVTWLRIRTLFLRTLAAASDLVGTQSPSPTTNDVSSSKNGEDPGRGATLRRLTDEWQELIDKTKDDPIIHKKFPIQGPHPARSSMYVNSNHPAILVQLFRIASIVHQLQVDVQDPSKSSKLQDSADERLTAVTDLLTEMLRKSRRSVIFEDCDRKKFDKHLLSELVALAETMTFAILLTSVVCKLMKPVKATINKKSKKKRSGGGATSPKPMPPVFDRFRQYLESLHVIADGLQSALQDIDTSFITQQFDSLNLLGIQESPKKLFEDQETVEADMWKKIEDSYKVSTQEITEVLKKRITYLKSLKI